jgi:hypothetical protein
MSLVLKVLLYYFAFITAVFNLGEAKIQSQRELIDTILVS